VFDRVEIIVKAGNGGDGAVSFRREKFVPFGGPDGGDGGDGGDVFIKADQAATSLSGLRYKRYYRAGNGEPGKSKKKHGKRGEDLILTVPVGTVVSYKTQISDNTVIDDLEQAGQQVVVARGGRGGWGNVHFVSSANQAPRMAEKGEAGEESSIILELRLIADVGIIGYPNAGKSTLLAAASAAKPRIASYPFTTRSPELGVVEVGLRTFVLAEIPGLIAGAHLGRGLGHDFLRHVARTRLIIHLVDGTSRAPVEDMLKVNAELSLYDSALARKQQLVVVNKIDLPEVQARQPEIKDNFDAAGVKVYFISAATKEGVSELMAETMDRLSQITRQEPARETPKKVFRPQPKVTTEVHKEGDTFVVTSPELERLVARMSDTTSGVRWQLKWQLQRLGIARALTKAGVKPGDRVRCGNLEWEWG
jgi:GTP-binding protein